MAKAVTGATILHEEQAWGVRLILRPFMDPRQNVNMEISTEIKRVEGRNPEIKIWFSGVPTQKLMPYTDAVIWGKALAAMLEEARKIADEMKEEPAPRKRKKA